MGKQKLIIKSDDEPTHTGVWPSSSFGVYTTESDADDENYDVLLTSYQDNCGIVILSMISNKAISNVVPSLIERLEENNFSDDDHEICAGAVSVIQCTVNSELQKDLLISRGFKELMVHRSRGSDNLIWTLAYTYEYGE